MVVSWTVPLFPGLLAGLENHSYKLNQAKLQEGVAEHQRLLEGDLPVTGHTGWKALRGRHFLLPLKVPSSYVC